MKYRRTRGCIWVNNSYSLLTGTVLEEALLGAIVASTSQTREVEQNWDLAAACVRWEVQIQSHFAASC